jgi:hypothetical protein
VIVRKKPIRPMLRSTFLLIGALLQALAWAHAQSGKAKALLQANYVATGGTQWSAIAQVRSTGSLNLAGALGTFRTVIDLKGGRDATSLDAGPVHIKQVNLTNSSWQSDASAIVTYADTPDAKADAIDQSFIDRNGWFAAPSSALKYLGITKDQDRDYDLISVIPSGGRSLTLWLGSRDHLLHRLDQLDASHQQTTIVYSDYREVAGVLIPYSIRQSNGTASQDMIQIVKSVRVSSSVDEAAFVAPVSKFGDATVLGKQSSASIPFTLADGRLCVEVSVEGRAPLPFLLDTGAGNVMTPEAAKSLSIEGSGSVPLSGAGESQASGQFANVQTLRLGRVQVLNQQFVIASLPAFLQDRGNLPPIAGLVGAELLRRFPTTIDYQHHLLTFYRPGSVPPRPANAQEIKLLFKDGHPFLSVEVDGVAGVFGLDTGDSSGMTIFQPFYDAHRFPVEQPGIPRMQGGIGGLAPALLTRVATLRMGASVLNEPVITLNFADKGLFSADGIAGNLGYHFLRNFVFTLDYEHRVGYFTRSEDFDKVAVYNRSGLTLIRANDGGLMAERVNPETPAARSGLQVGDRIVEIDGKHTAEVASEVFVRTLSAAAGSTVTMVFSHQGQRRYVTFSLEELLPSGGSMKPLGGPPPS